MTEVTAAGRAMHFRARHKEAAVGLGADSGVLLRLGETWPAGARVELIGHPEQRRTAASATEPPWPRFLV